MTSDGQPAFRLNGSSLQRTYGLRASTDSEKSLSVEDGCRYDRPSGGGDNCRSDSGGSGSGRSGGSGGATFGDMSGHRRVRNALEIRIALMQVVKRIIRRSRGPGRVPEPLIDPVQSIAQLLKSDGRSQRKAKGQPGVSNSLSNDEGGAEKNDVKN
jgi:hypothetical protein